ncbi:OB-fold protein [Aquimarina rubra]|uniref:tRNA_anti-like n=1 Tax=Aquimarina rubra TaxID=1920033 RepID=A0ABW5LCS3_9FLAO
MKKKSVIIFFLFCLLFIGSVFVYFKFYNETLIDIDKVSTEIKISSERLTASFITNEKNADLIYKGKIIEVEGVIKEVSFLNNRNTVILYGNNKYSGVLCDLQSNQTMEIKNLTKGDKVVLKGVCKGFLKDAILLNCMLINQQSNE